MSERYETETTLVTDESNYYDTGLDTAIALTIVGFFLGILTLVEGVALTTSGDALGTLFLTILAVVVGGVGTVAAFSYLNVVPIVSQRVRGVGLGLLISVTGLTLVAYALPVTMATLLGMILLTQALALVVAGAVSRADLVDTSPSRSSGLAAGLAFGFIGILVGGVAGGTLAGFGSALWLPVTVAVGVGFGLLAVVPREDVGSSLATALIVGLLGLTITTGVFTVEWTWDPTAIDGGFTGGVVIPLFVVVGSLLSSWGTAKSRAGFGAQGRQYGAFFLINLNAALMVVIMVSVVFFVVSNGAVYAFHEFSVGALTLLVVLLPILVAALNWARRPAGTADWHSGARQFFRVIPVAAAGSLAAVLVGILATGSTFTAPFQYTVLQNRTQESLDTSLEITASLDIGAWILFLSMTLVFGYFYRKTGSLQNIGSRSDLLSRVQAGVSLFVTLAVALTVVLAVFGKSPLGLPLASVVGLPLTYLGVAIAAALVVLPITVLVRTPEMATVAYDRSQAVTLGVYGGLASLLATALLETATAESVGVGSLALVSVVALLGSAASLLLTALLVRGSQDAGDHQRVLRTQITLALAGVAGFLAILALHVALTQWTVDLAGITVANGGSLSWPFVMESELPLAPDSGGIFPAIVGTVWLVVGASMFAVPLGVGAAVFLTEYAEQGYFTSVVEVATNALWSTPSVVFGLFGAAFLLPRFAGDTSLIAGQLVLGFMLLPLVLITSREAIKSVPDEYRDASAALGVSRWETIRSVVLPAAMPGVITGVILGVGRIAGETAPLILVLGTALNRPEPLDVLGGFELLGNAPFVFNGALLSETPALPSGIWAIITAGVSGSTSRGWATAFVLLTVVLLFYAIGIVSRTYFRRKLNYE